MGYLPANVITILRRFESTVWSKKRIPHLWYEDSRSLALKETFS
jgi:hypothetical protein